MWTCQVTREEFLTLIQAERRFKAPYNVQIERSSDLPPRRSELLAAWKRDPRETPTLPSVVVVPASGTRDFLAWTSTYLADYRPFTAQVRVLEEGHAERYFQPHRLWLGRIQDACAALIIAETVAYLEGGRDPGSLPAVTFGNTYSFIRGRDLGLWGPPRGDDALFDSWRSARSLMGQPRSALDPREVQLPWNVIVRIATGNTSRAVGSDEELLVHAAEELFGNGTVGEDLWRRISIRAGLAGDMALLRKASREERVIALEAIARQKPERESVREAYAFLCGYLANTIAPGSLDHLALVHRSFHHCRSVLLWYGLCAGLTPTSTVRDAFNGIGRRLLRDVLDDACVLDPPKGDLALAELKMFEAQGPGRRAFFTATSNYVQVELAPCITTVIRWGTAESGAPSQGQLFDLSGRKTDPSVEMALIDIRDMLGRLEAAHKRLLKNLGLDVQPRRPPGRDEKS